jgi:hypothetical protein
MRFLNLFPDETFPAFEYFKVFFSSIIKINEIEIPSY